MHKGTHATPSSSTIQNTHLSLDVLSLHSHMHQHPSFQSGLQQPLDPLNLYSPMEQPTTQNLSCFFLTPLIHTPGCCVVTQTRLYFQAWRGQWDTMMDHPTTTTTTSHDHVEKRIPPKATSWILSSVVATARRYHGLRDVALEIFFQTEPSILLAFASCIDRESVLKQVTVSKNNAIPCHTHEHFIEQALQAWLKGYIDNFEYLLLINSASGRTFHDLSRYPVFPWVLADYISPKLDLSNLLTPFNKARKQDSVEYTTTTTLFRDLEKPVGALNDQRLEYFQTRFKNMQDMDQAFLYGTHYSAPGYVLYYLVRMMPEHMLCLQNGLWI